MELAEIAYSAREVYLDIEYYISLMEFQGKITEMLNDASDITKGVKKTEIKDWRTNFVWPAETPNGETSTP